MSKSKFTVPTKQEVSASSKAILETLEKNVVGFTNSSYGLCAATMVSKPHTGHVKI